MRANLKVGGKHHLKLELQTKLQTELQTELQTDIAGVRVSAITTRAVMDFAIERAADRAGEPALICYANAWAVSLARDHPSYARILNEHAAVVYADGQSVIWASRLLSKLRGKSNPSQFPSLPERVNLGDFWLPLLQRLSERGVSIYLLGGAPGEAAAAGKAARKAVPELRIAGTRDGYFKDAEAASVAQAIHDAAPGVVFVGMGAPRQELWAAQYLAAMRVPVVWCVGALFEYYSGRRRRAPVWMRRCGLEWLFRLALEPGRLWRRYLIGNLRFMYLVFRQAIGAQKKMTG